MRHGSTWSYTLCCAGVRRTSVDISQEVQRTSTVNVRITTYFRIYGFPLVGLSAHVIDVFLATYSRQSSWMILPGKILNVKY
jgi:hypothetical protein